jgi:hypothetical protein
MPRGNAMVKYTPPDSPPLDLLTVFVSDEDSLLDDSFCAPFVVSGVSAGVGVTLTLRFRNLRVMAIDRSMYRGTSKLIMSRTEALFCFIVLKPWTREIRTDFASLDVTLSISNMFASLFL